MTQPVLATHSLTHTRTPHKYTHAYKRTAMHGTRTRTSGHCLTSPKIKAAKNRRGQWRGGAGRQGDGWGWPRADEGEGARRVCYFSAKVKVIIIIHSKGCCCTPSPRRRRRRTEGDDMKKKERKKKKKGRRRNRFPPENVGSSGVCRWQSGQCDSHLCGP